MFVTINLYLNMSFIINELVMRELVNENRLYQRLRLQFKRQGVNINYVEKHLINTTFHYPGSLLSEEASGVASINKFYGCSTISPVKAKLQNGTSNDEA